MLNILEEWSEQVNDAKEFIKAVVNSRLVRTSSIATLPSGLIATVVLNPSLKSDREPVIIYFDSSKGFSFVNEGLLNDFESESTDLSGQSEPLPFVEFGPSTEIFPTLMGLIMSLDTGRNAFHAALAEALSQLKHD